MSSIHHFYFPELNSAAKEINFSKSEELHHMRTVLRLKPSDKIIFFNGRGEEAVATITSIEKQKAKFSVETLTKTIQKEPLITLACAIPKREKFEFILEKATELNIHQIIPMLTARTEIKISNKDISKKTDRFQTIVINACKQSKRNFVPTVFPATSFKDVVSRQSQETLALIPSLLGEPANLIQTLEKIARPKEILILIGPEGDFTPEEYALAQKFGCIPVTLGETVLKVETAAICALSCVNVFYSK